MGKKYSSDTTALMEQLRKNTFENPSAAVSLGKRLLRTGKETHDDYLCGYAGYFLNTSYFVLGKTDEFLKNHPVVLRYLTLSGQYKFAVRYHNRLGQVAASQNNIALALNHYLKALALSRKHRLIFDEGVSYNYIGELYKCIGQYDAALTYFHKAESYCRRSPDYARFYSILILIHTSMCFCSYRQGDKETVNQLLDYLDSVSHLAEDSYHQTAVLCVRFCCCHRFHMPEERDALFPDLLAALDACSSVYEFYTYFWEVCSILDELGQGSALIEVIHILESKLDEKQRHASPFLILRLLSYKVNYYKKLNNPKHYHHALEEYYYYKEQQIQFSKAFTKSILDLRIQTEKLNQDQKSIEEQIRQLKHKSERDPLTGLANYSYLKERMELLFETARQKQESFGVAILDIDYFKQYNDTYGHQSGDEALNAVAGILKKLVSEQVFCARYGGDEFILLFSHMTDFEILSACEQVKTELADRRIPHEGNPSGSYLSVSQGIRNSVPVPANKPWDYLFAADMALYDVKEHHRSGIHLVHRYTLPENMTKEVRRKV